MLKPYLNFLNRQIHTKISRKNLLILVSIFIGLVAGLAAIALKAGVHHLHLILERYSDPRPVLMVVFPLVGIVLTVFYFVFIQRSTAGKSITDIIYDIEQKSSVVEGEKTYSHLISSAITVGFGGSTGLEAPIVVTGSAIGSNIAKWFQFNYKERTLLLACGASAGIAAIFSCPVGGVLFSIEVLLGEFSIPAFIPLLVSTATASVLTRLLYQEGHPFVLYSAGWRLISIPFYFAFGLLMGLVSVYFTTIVMKVKNLFSLNRHVWTKALVGGLILGLLIFLLPQLFGEGYGTIQTLLSGKYGELLDKHWFQYGWIPAVDKTWFIVLIALILALIKPVAASVTLGGGGNGGVFAPSLFSGALLGFVFATVVNFSGVVYLPDHDFIAAGMAGLLAGTFHAPLTAVFLIAETTGGYVLFVPLMIVSALSYFIARYIEPYTLYTKRLAKKGALIRADKDKQVLNQMRIIPFIETNFSSVPYEATLGQLVDVVAHSKRNIFPVLDVEHHLKGILLLEDLSEVMFDRDLYDKTFVKDLMTQPPALIHKDESMMNVLKKFEDVQAWILPVIFHEKFEGFVSKAALFSQYRTILIKQSLQQI